MSTELHPGAYFEIEGESFEYVGIRKTPDDQNNEIVAKIDSGRGDEALHRVIPVTVLQEKGSNFWNFSEGLRYADFVAQYTDRLKTLRNTNILQTLSTGEEGIIGIDGNEYPVSSMENIRNSLLHNSTELNKKVEQGFTRLQLTPLAASLSYLSERVKEALLKHAEEGTIFEQKRYPTDLDVPIKLKHGDPTWAWSHVIYEETKREVIYFPTSYERNKHQGLPKWQVLENPEYCLSPGWSISLIEEDTYLPRQGRGEVLGGRPQLENNKTASEYLILLRDEAYIHETGFTHEDFLIDFLNRLEETNHVSYEVNYNQTLLIGTYLPLGNQVPVELWNYYDKTLESRYAETNFFSQSQGVKTAVRLRQ